MLHALLKERKGYTSSQNCIKFALKLKSKRIPGHTVYLSFCKLYVKTTIDGAKRQAKTPISRKIAARACKWGKSVLR